MTSLSHCHIPGVCTERVVAADAWAGDCGADAAGEDPGDLFVAGCVCEADERGFDCGAAWRCAGAERIAAAGAGDGRPDWRMAVDVPVAGAGRVDDRG